MFSRPGGERKREAAKERQEGGPVEETARPAKPSATADAVADILSAAATPPSPVLDLAPPRLLPLPSHPWCSPR
jgi:hypothetical protein